LILLGEVTLILIFFFCFGILASLIINNILLRFSKNLGIRNKNDVSIRWSNESKPSLGGISLFAVFLFSFIAVAALFPSLQIFTNSHFLALITGGTLAFVIGITDDAYNTRPLLKLGGQILCGILIVYSDLQIELFHHQLYDQIFTVFWVVLIMNSLNMLDNMDGITGTISFFILLLTFISLTLIYGGMLNAQSILLVAVIGALIGFLYYNINPSKMFMGDTGSQFISFFIAFMSIENLWNFPRAFDMPSWSGALLVLTIFTPAGVDTLTVVINRLRKKQSPMVGGKDHTTHHLVYKGLSDFKVWVVFLALGSLSLVIGIILLFLIELQIVIYTLVGLFYFIFVFFLLYRNTQKYKRTNE
jgi:UDP-GlcNAc:undecaprenyl-phosphate GlcNAc-1-phosphate transferase